MIMTYVPYFLILRHFLFPSNMYIFICLYFFLNLGCILTPVSTFTEVISSFLLSCLPPFLPSLELRNYYKFSCLTQYSWVVYKIFPMEDCFLKLVVTRGEGVGKNIWWSIKVFPDFFFVIKLTISYWAKKQLYFHIFSYLWTYLKTDFI